MATKTIKTETTETHDTEREAMPLEAWLESLATQEGVMGVFIYKNVNGKWARTFDMKPPFTDDLESIFKTRGDGEYRFMPYNSQKRYITTRYETVAGYGDGKSAVTARPDDDDDDDIDGLMKSMRKELRLRMLQDMIESQEERRRERKLRTVPTEAKPFDVKEMLGLVATLAGAFKDNTSAALMPVLLEKAFRQTPASEFVAGMKSLLELKDVMSPPDNGMGGLDDIPGWLKAVLMMGNTPIGQGLVQAFVARAATHAATPALPAHPSASPPAHVETPPPPATAARAPESVAADGAAATGHPPNAVLDAYKMLQEKISPIIKAAARKGSTAYLSYADMIEDALPGFIGQWVEMPFEQAAQMLAQFDPEWVNDPTLTQWLSACHQAVKDDAESGDDE